jgi:hypothetical protein
MPAIQIPVRMAVVDFNTEAFVIANVNSNFKAPTVKHKHRNLTSQSHRHIHHRPILKASAVKIHVKMAVKQ